MPVATPAAVRKQIESGRADPIYPTTVVGVPPMEDVWMGKATERLFLPLLRLFLPEIVDVCMPPHGIFHSLVLVSIRKRYPGQARKVIHGLWGMGLLMLAKAIVVFDDGAFLGQGMVDPLPRSGNILQAAASPCIDVGLERNQS